MAGCWLHLLFPLSRRQLLSVTGLLPPPWGSRWAHTVAGAPALHGPGSPRATSATEPQEPAMQRALGIWKAVSPTAAYPKPSSSLVVWGCLAWSPLILNDSIVPSLAFQEEEAGEQGGHRAGYCFKAHLPWDRAAEKRQLAPKRHCAVKLAMLHMQPCLQLLAWVQMPAQQDAPHIPQDSLTVTAGKGLCSPLFSLPFLICGGFCPAPAQRVAQPCKDLSCCMKKRGHEWGSEWKAWKYSFRKGKLVFKVLTCPVEKEKNQVHRCNRK